MINIALIGSGYWGSKIISSLEGNPTVGKFQIIDVKNGDTVDDIESDIKTAIVATPLWDHFDTGANLLARGFDCYIEKPMAETEHQCQLLKGLQQDRILMVGHIFLYHPAMTWIKDNINRIGAINHIDSQRLNWGIYQTKTTPMHSLLPHDVSIMLELLGEGVVVTEVDQCKLSDNQQPDYVNFNMVINGVSVRVTGSWYWPEKIRKITIIGTQGSIVWDDVANRVDLYQGTVNDRRLSELTLVDSYTPDLTASPLQLELEHFIDCVNTRSTPKSDVNNAIAVAKVVDAVVAQLDLDRRHSYIAL
jgi:predicted dehydrogenase